MGSFAPSNLRIVGRIAATEEHDVHTNRQASENPSSSSQQVPEPEETEPHQGPFSFPPVTTPTSEELALMARALTTTRRTRGAFQSSPPRYEHIYASAAFTSPPPPYDGSRESRPPRYSRRGGNSRTLAQQYLDQRNVDSRGRRSRRFQRSNPIPVWEVLLESTWSWEEPEANAEWRRQMREWSGDGANESLSRLFPPSEALLARRRSRAIGEFTRETERLVESERFEVEL